MCTSIVQFAVTHGIVLLLGLCAGLGLIAISVGFPSRRAAGVGWCLLVAAASLALPVRFARADQNETKSAPKAEHVQSLLQEKYSRTPTERKITCHLLFALRKLRGQEPIPGVPTLQVDMPTDVNGRVAVEINTAVTGGIINALQEVGAVEVKTFPEAETIYATVPLGQLDAIAALPEVKRIMQPSREETETVGVVDTEGDKAHNTFGETGARFIYHTGGVGVNVGVLSNGVDLMQDSIKSGDLPDDLTIVKNAAGVAQAGSGNEGTAMLEIVHDMAPGATLFFATGSGGSQIMADNIRTLANPPYNCGIIIDDKTYTDESPFQDGGTGRGGVIAQAVHDVSDKGVLVFSSAANSGNQASKQSSAWEGDFVDGGLQPTQTDLTSKFFVDQVHSYGTQLYNTNPDKKNSGIQLFWNDPLGKSTNDYDLVVTDDNNKVTDVSTDIQDGTQDPFEEIAPQNIPSDGTPPNGRHGNRIYILKSPSAATRFLHLATPRHPLQFSTNGNTSGHHACSAANAFCVAAAPAFEPFSIGEPPGPYQNAFTTSSHFEGFSSDGPRRLFYRGDGTALSSDLSATGGLVASKPDLTAADGVSTFTKGKNGPTGKSSSFAPFYGTSAAAPHAGAIAALLKSKFPNATPADIRNALVSTALKLKDAQGKAALAEDVGAGIMMPLPALQKLGTLACEIGLVGATPDKENPDTAVQVNSAFATVKINVAVTNAPTGGGMVHVFTQNGTAKSDSQFNEYNPVSQTISFPAGNSSTPVSIQVNNTPDFEFPNNGTFTLNLDTAVNGTITHAQATITIIKTQAAENHLTLENAQVTRGNPDADVPGGKVFAHFRARLSKASDRPVKVHFATVGQTAVAGTHYTATVEDVTFDPGETDKIVLVEVLDPAGQNQPESTFGAHLTSPTNVTIDTPDATCTIHQPQTPAQAVNIATRLRVLTNDNVLIGGFIVTGTEQKKVIVRAIGPSLAAGIPDALMDPVLSIVRADGSVLATNDDWKQNQAAVQATGVAPTDDRESAIVATLDPGAYTAIVSGKNGLQGVGLVEVYDLSPHSNSQLGNISTRGFVDTGDNVMIGGFITGVNAENGPSRLLVRGLGPSLPVQGRLADPTVELHDGNGSLIAFNDNWRDSQQDELAYTGIPPTNDLESAIVKTLAPGAYTAVLRGAGGGVGVGLIEVYKLD
ncbi:MAG: S8 family serine peptidase [Verrucomicrobiota bacterium]|nr:S8 family serine peptidase [Verrucomicrobiota bacterium]